MTLTVAKSGAEYTSVQAAVNAVPENPTVPYTILIGPGTYDETVTIPAGKPDLTLQGSTGNPADAVITAANYNGETDPSGGTYGTSPAYPVGLVLRGVHFDVTATTAQDADITEARLEPDDLRPGVTVTRTG